MKISNRSLGYISFVVFIGIVAYISYSMYNAHRGVRNMAIVDFNELGTLQPEDPVVVRGYKVGTIGSVKWLGDRARITIKFDTPLILREGTEFNNVNFALMGQRRMEITPSKTGKVMPTDHIFTGHFEPGIAEALRLIENVNQQVSAIRDIIILLANGDSTHLSATDIYEKTLHSIEGFLDNTDKQLSIISPQIDKLFKQVNQASNTIKSATFKIDTATKTITGNVNKKIESIQVAMKSASDGIVKANDYLTDIETNILSKDILKTTETLQKFNHIIEKLNKLVKAINTKGIKVYDNNGKPIKLIKWKNINIIGDRAQDKIKARTEQEKNITPSHVTTPPNVMQTNSNPATNP